MSDKKLGFKDYVKGAKGISKASLGVDAASEQIIQERFQICLNCPKLIVKQKKLSNKKFFKCGACGCFLGYKIKIKSEKCPLNKW
ncbi:MAG: hypothetical protein ACOCQD_02715 [archaeon]